jgi:hypothetical protein
MWSVVVGSDRLAGWLTVGPGGPKIGRDDFCVAVFPLTANRPYAFCGCQINRGSRFS